MAQTRARAACISADLATRSATLDQQLAQISDHLASIPGRKNLIWMANRFPVSRTTPFFKLTNANVAVYPVDENGVCRNCPPAEKNAMQAVAAMTGGLAYFERNDLDTVVREASEDGNVS